MYHKKTQFTFLLLALLLAATFLGYFIFNKPIDAISVREMNIEKDKMDFIKKIEINKYKIDKSEGLNRRYFRINLENKNCIFAFYDPPVPVNNYKDDLYCFDNVTGNYVGKM